MMAQAPDGGSSHPRANHTHHHRHTDSPSAASSTAHVKLFGDTCGHFWRSSYTRHHQSILAGLEPAKYAVSLGADVGLADRLVGTFSVFYFALLSGRAFQIATYPGVVDLREALEPAFINWSRAEVDERVIQNIK